MPNYDMSIHLSVSSQLAALDQASVKIESVASQLDKLDRHSANIRVTADTSGFDTKVDAASGKVDALSHKGANVRISADTSGFDTKVDSASAKVETLSRRGADVRITADTSGFDTRVDTASTKIENLSRKGADIKVDANTAGADAKVDQFAAKIENLKRLSAVAKVEVDTATGLAALEAVEAGLSKVDGEIARAKVDVDTIEGITRLGELSAEVKAVGAETADVRVEVDAGKAEADIGIIQALLVKLGLSHPNIKVEADVGQANAALIATDANAAATGASMAGLGAGAQGAVIGVVALAVAISGPLIAGLTIATATVLALVAGIALIAAPIVIAVKQIADYNKGLAAQATAQKAAQTASDTYQKSLQSLGDAQKNLSSVTQQANQSVGDAQKQAAQGVSQAIDTHKKDLVAAGQAEQSYQHTVEQGAQSVADAQKQANSQVQQAIATHIQDLQAVKDAEASYAHTVEQGQQSVADAQRQAQAGVQQAIQTHIQDLQAVKDAEVSYQHTVEQGARAVVAAQQQAAQGVSQAVSTYKQDLQTIATDIAAYHSAQQQQAQANQQVTQSYQALELAQASEQRRLAEMTNSIDGMRIGQKQLQLSILDAQKTLSHDRQGTEQYQKDLLNLQSLQNQYKGSSLSIKDAEDQLAQSRKNGTSQLQSSEGQYKSSLDQRKQAEQGVAAANQKLLQDGQKAAKDYAAIDQARADGAQKVAQAQQDAAYANRQALQGVTRAQEKASQDEKKIEQARADGARSIAKAQKDAAYANQQSLQGVIRAQQKANQDQGKIDQARKDGAQSVAKAQKDAAYANSQALQQVSAANQKAADSEKKIEQARKDGAQSVARAQRQASDQISKAQDQVAKAQAQVAADAKKMQAAQKAAANAAPFLSAANKQLLDSFNGLKRVAGAAFAPAQGAAARLASQVIGLAKSAMPSLGRASKQTIQAVSGVLSQLRKELSTPVERASAVRILNSIPRQTGIAVHALGTFGGALMNVFAQAMPFVTNFLRYLDKLATRFLHYTESAKGQREINHFFAAAIPVFSALAKLVGVVVGGLVSFGVNHAKGIATGINLVTSAVRFLGKVFGLAVDGFGWLVREGKRLAPGLEKAILPVFHSIVSGAKKLWPQIKPGVNDIISGFKAMQPILKPLGAFVGGALLGAFQALGPVLILAFRGAAKLFDYLGRAIGWVGKQLTPFTPQIHTLGRVFGYVFGTVILGAVGKGISILGRLAEYIPTLGPIIAAPLRAIGGSFQWVSRTVTRVVEGILGAWGGLPRAIVAVGRHIGSALLSPFQWVYDKLLGHSIIPDITNGVVDALGKLPGRIGKALGSVPGVVGDIFQSAWKSGSKFLGNLGDDAKSITGNAADWIGKNLGRGRDTGSSALSDLKKWGTNSTQDLRDNARSAMSDAADWVTKNLKRGRDDGSSALSDLKKWGTNSSQDLRDHARSAMSDAADWITKNLKRGRDDGSSALSDLKKWGSNSQQDLKSNSGRSMDNTRQDIKNFLKDAKEGGLSRLRELRDSGQQAMDQAGKRYSDPVGKSSSDLQNYLNDMLYGMGQVIDKAGLSLKKPEQYKPRISGHSGVPGTSTGPARAMATGGVVGPGGPLGIQKLGAVTLMAAGGVMLSGGASPALAQTATGGMADGKTPRAVYGEVKSPEAYIVKDRPTTEQMPFLQTAADWHDMALVPKDAFMQADAKSAGTISVESGIGRATAHMTGQSRLKPTTETLAAMEYAASFYERSPEQHPYIPHMHATGGVYGVPGGKVNFGYQQYVPGYQFSSDHKHKGIDIMGSESYVPYAGRVADNRADWSAGTATTMNATGQKDGKNYSLVHGHLNPSTVPNIGATSSKDKPLFAGKITNISLSGKNMGWQPHLHLQAYNEGYPAHKYTHNEPPLMDPARAWAAIGAGGKIPAAGASGSGGGSAPVDITPYIDKYIKKVPDFSKGLPGKEAHGEGQKARDAIVKLLNDHAPMSSSGGKGGSGGVSGNPGAGQGGVAQWMAKNARGRAMPGELPVMTSLVESGLKNLNYGDRDSLGYFQQRPSAGWGTPSQIMDPSYSLGKFLDRAAGYKGSYPYSAGGLGAWSQRVQGSAFPDRYAQQWDNARSLIGKNLQGYKHGGLALQPHTTQVAEVGKELMVPLNDKRAASDFKDFIKNLEPRPGESGHAPIRENDEYSKRLEKSIEKLNHDLSDKFEKRMKQAEEEGKKGRDHAEKQAQAHAAAALAVASRYSKGPQGREDFKKHYEEELARELRKLGIDH